MPVVDRKNARVWIADKESGFTVPVFLRWSWKTEPMFSRFMKDELPGVPQKEF